MIATDNGSATISPVAVALSGCDVAVRDLTLRTPTLDDVFLELTGSHIERDSHHRGGRPMSVAEAIAPTTASEGVLRARPAGFVRDTATIAGRALRARAARPRGGVPARLHRAVLLHRERRHAEEPHAVRRSQGSTTRRSRCPPRSCSASPACRARPAVVLDVQNGYLDRLLMTPIRRLSILLGHMVADIAVAIGLTVPILARRVRHRRALRDRRARRPGVRRPGGAVEPGVRRASATPSPSRPATRRR